MTVSARTTLQQALAAHIHKTRQGDVEDPTQREIAYGDVDGDGVRDAVVLYTLEQVRGNGWGQVLAVFLYKKGSYRFVADEVVGGKFFRSFEAVKIVGHEISGQTRTCLGKGAACDNPLKQQVRVVLVGTTLQER